MLKALSTICLLACFLSACVTQPYQDSSLASDLNKVNMRIAELEDGLPKQVAKRCAAIALEVSEKETKRRKANLMTHCSGVPVITARFVITNGSSRATRIREKHGCLICRVIPAKQPIWPMRTPMWLRKWWGYWRSTTLKWCRRCGILYRHPPSTWISTFARKWILRRTPTCTGVTSRFPGVVLYASCDYDLLTISFAMRQMRSCPQQA